MSVYALQPPPPSYLSYPPPSYMSFICLHISLHIYIQYLHHPLLLADTQPPTPDSLLPPFPPFPPSPSWQPTPIQIQPSHREKKPMPRHPICADLPVPAHPLPTYPRVWCQIPPGVLHPRRLSRAPPLAGGTRGLAAGWRRGGSAAACPNASVAASWHEDGTYVHI